MSDLATDGTIAQNILEGSRILITGGTGSLGSALIAALHQKYNPEKIIVYSRDEKKQHDLQQQLGFIQQLRCLLGDVRDLERLKEACRGVDYVINAAAYKHISKCEYNPLEAVKTNVIGAANVVKACLECGVKKAIQIGTDKQASASTIYGATKLCAERLFIASNAYQKTHFSGTRWGNVVASRGSVIETFTRLRDQGIHEFPITNLDATRFWITLPQAAEVVLQALAIDKKIVIPLCPSMKVVDVARAVDPECTFREVGLQGYEKLHECLVMPEERIPGFENGYYSHLNDRWYTIEQFRELL